MHFLTDAVTAVAVDDPQRYTVPFLSAACGYLKCVRDIRQTVSRPHREHPFGENLTGRVVERLHVRLQLPDPE